MKFEELVEKKIAVNCKTEEEAKRFLDECKKNGVKWAGIQPKTDATFWNFYQERTHYSLYSGYITYGTKEVGFSKGFTIIDFNDIDEFKKPEMTAKELLEKYNKICTFYKNREYKCNDCVLGRMNNGYNKTCLMFMSENPYEALKVVAEWEEPLKKYKVTYKTVETVEAKSEKEAI